MGCAASSTYPVRTLDPQKGAPAACASVAPAALQSGTPRGSLCKALSNTASYDRQSAGVTLNEVDSRQGYEATLTATNEADSRQCYELNPNGALIELVEINEGSITQVEAGCSGKSKCADAKGGTAHRVQPLTAAALRLLQGSCSNREKPAFDVGGTASMSVESTRCGK